MYRNVTNLYCVRCMHVDEGTGISVEVADVYCDPVMQPPDLNACHVACPGTCVLGPWSDWSDCPQVCIAIVLSGRRCTYTIKCSVTKWIIRVCNKILC